MSGQGKYLGKIVKIPHNNSKLEFELVEFLGAGFMGEVYRGVSEVSEESILEHVFKFPRSKEFHAHIKRAARIMEKLRSHQNIIEYKGFGISEELELPYLRFEYLKGKDLGTYIADKKKEKGGIDPNKTIHVIFQVIGAIEYVHSLEEPIIHTDLTPSNIWIVGDSVVKVMDFGLAQIIKEIDKKRFKELMDSRGRKYYVKSDRPKEGGLWTNISEYIAPEVRHEGRFTPQCDVYSIAKILHFCITGQDVGDEGVATDILEQKEWGFMENVIKKGIKTDLNKRFKSVAEMREAIKKSIMNQELRGFNKVYFDAREFIRIPRYHPDFGVTSDKGVLEIGEKHEQFLKESSLHRGNPTVEEKIKEIDELLKNRIVHDVTELLTRYRNKGISIGEKKPIRKILEAWKHYPVTAVRDYCKTLDVEIKNGPINIDGKEYTHISMF